MIDDSYQTNGEQISEIVPPSMAGQMQSAHSDKIKIHIEPRISANKLAEYVLADPSRQRTITRESKFSNVVITVPYTKTRNFIARAFTSDSLDIDKLGQRAAEIESENEVNGISDWHKNDNANSALALKKIIAIAPDLSWKNARIVHGRLGGIKIAGVHVSVQPELIFTFEHRNISKVGAILLNTAKRDEKSLARNNGGYCVGDYLSSLLFQMLLSKSPRVAAPLNSKCFAIDVFREKIYTAPASYRTLNKNLEAACEVIASRWAAIQFKA
jgi:hypothetical protein